MTEKFEILSEAQIRRKIAAAMTRIGKHLERSDLELGHAHAELSKLWLIVGPEYSGNWAWEQSRRKHK